MSEYIERELAIEYARLHYCKDCNSYNGVRCGSCGFDDAILLIEDVQAADVVEVRHGEWISHEGYEECNLCHTKTIYQHHYCPNCGAKMDGKGEWK